MTTYNNTLTPAQKSKLARILLICGLLSTQACSGVVAYKAPWDKGFHVVAGDEPGTEADAIRRIGTIEAAKNQRASTTHTTYRAKIAQSLKDAIAALATKEDESEEVAK